MQHFLCCFLCACQAVYPAFIYFLVITELTAWKTGERCGVQGLQGQCKHSDEGESVEQVQWAQYKVICNFQNHPSALHPSSLFRDVFEQVSTVKEWCAGSQPASLSGTAWGNTGSHLFSYTTHIDRWLSSGLLIHPSCHPPLWEQSPTPPPTHLLIIFSVSFNQWAFVVLDYFDVVAVVLLTMLDMWPNHQTTVILILLRML